MGIRLLISGSLDHEHSATSYLLLRYLKEKRTVLRMLAALIALTFIIGIESIFRLNRAYLVPMLFNFSFIWILFVWYMYSTLKEFFFNAFRNSRLRDMIVSGESPERIARTSIVVFFLFFSTICIFLQITEFVLNFKNTLFFYPEYFSATLYVFHSISNILLSLLLIFWTTVAWVGKFANYEFSEFPFTIERVVVTWGSILIVYLHLFALAPFYSGLILIHESTGLFFVILAKFLKIMICFLLIYLIYYKWALERWKNIDEEWLEKYG